MARNTNSTMVLPSNRLHRLLNPQIVQNFLDIFAVFHISKKMLHDDMNSQQNLI
jgi:hypothetical protein